jgi:hypothetical protein
MGQVDLGRLRVLLEETDVGAPRTRGTMKRTVGGVPSLTDKVFAQRAEIDALRRGLSDAIAEIERLNATMVEYG